MRIPILCFPAMAALIFGAAPPVDIVDGGFGPRCELLWDPVLTDVDGQPETLSGYEIAITTPAVDMRTAPEGTTPLVQAFASPEATRHDLSPIVADLLMKGATNGSRYRFWIRAIDQAGNISGWSNFWEGHLDSRPPSPPSNGGCKLIKG